MLGCAPAAYMGGFGGARKPQLEGIPGYYQYFLLVQEDVENNSSKARYVARTASIEIETLAASPVCV